MKAICIRPFSCIRPFIFVEKGETVDVTIENGKFIFTNIDATMSRSCFFNHFVVNNSEVKMTYSDFEYILCNYVFTMAMFYPQDMCNGEHFLIIKDWDTRRIYISCNENEGIIRVSFNHNDWDQYKSYEDALDSIRNHN